MAMPALGFKASRRGHFYPSINYRTQQQASTRLAALPLERRHRPTISTGTDRMPKRMKRCSLMQLLRERSSVVLESPNRLIHFEPEELIGGHFENVGELDQRIGSDTRNLPFPSQHGLLCHAEHLRELSLRNAGLLTRLHDAFAEGGSQLGGGSSFACHAAIIRRFLEK